MCLICAELQCGSRPIGTELFILCVCTENGEERNMLVMGCYYFIVMCIFIFIVVYIVLMRTFLVLVICVKIVLTTALYGRSGTAENSGDVFYRV